MLSGQWEFFDGALRGSQLAADGRAGFIVHYQRFTSAVIQFDLKLEGRRQVIFRIQDAIPEHICSVRIAPDAFTAQKDDHAGPRSGRAVRQGRDAMPPDVPPPFQHRSISAFRQRAAEETKRP